jgi:GT2 family glycosyltransferase
MMTVSVVIPVFNGAATLARCLGALPSPASILECIVVDNGSSDESAEVAAAAGAVVLRTESRTGPAAARNLGAARASGDLLVFVDADVCMHADTVDRIRSHFEEDAGLDALIGSYDDEPAGAGFVSQYKNLLHHFVHQHGRAEAATFWTGCGAIRRRVFAAAGGFDESCARPCIEDIDLGYRLRQMGRRMLLDPAIQVKHLKRYGLGSLLRSDIFDRALPWTRLIVSSRKIPNDLNLSLAQRCSGAMALAAVVLAPVCAKTTFGAMLASLPLLGVVLLNHRFFRFLVWKKGWGFATGAAPLLWAYYLYSTLAFAAGVFLYTLVLRNTGSPADGRIRGCADPDALPPCS